MLSAQQYANQSGLIAGVDEVGRGPLAGPVYAAAVILDPQQPIEGLDDSKKLSAARRESLSTEIQTYCLACSVATASVEEIDRLNILQAALLAMRRAVDELVPALSLVLVDGNRLPRWNYPSQPVVKGDSKVKEIAAASILAKVARDQEMLCWHEHYPEYGLDRHKGYPTKYHLNALSQYGPTAIHRKSFAPVRKLLTEKT